MPLKGKNFDPLGSKFFPFKVDPFQNGTLYAGTETGNHKSCLSCEIWWKIHQVYPALCKHSFSSKLRILPPKNENLQMKNSGNFHISAQNIDCGYLLELPQGGSSNKYPQSMFLSRNKKINVYPCKPQLLLYRSGV